MSNDWQWNSPDWRQPDEGESLDKGLGNYPTQQSSGSGGSAPDPYWNPVSLPPPPPDPLPYAAYGPSSGPSTPPLFTDYGQSGNPYGQPPNNPYGPPPGGSYPFAPTSVARRRPRLRFVIPVLLFVVLCAGGIAASAYAYKAISSTVNQAAQQINSGSGANGGPVTIAVSGRPTIVIDRNDGAVQVQGVANSQQVVMKPAGQNASPGDGPIEYTLSSGNTITFDLSNIETVDVLLLVPTASNLNITNNDGDLTVSGVTGQQSLSSNGGSIHVTQDTLTGNSTLDTNGGSITFSGILDPNSADQFSTNPDPITITLPANASFHADITNNGGTIQSQFSQVVVSGDSASGDVGPAPRAQLEADSNGGTIELNKSS